MMALMDSCLASSIKPHVLMMTTSARAGLSVRVKPSRASVPSMTSLSTWFLEHPRLTKPIVAVRVRVRGVLNVREAMTRSVEEAGNPCQIRSSAHFPLDSACAGLIRSEEHTSELQSQSNLVCRLLLEKKKKNHHEVRRTPDR